MKLKLFVALAVIVLTTGFGNTVLGFDQEDVMIHGFASQGYLKSSANNYLGNSKDGSYEFNEIGINFLVPVTDDLQFGIQLFSRDLGDYGNNDLVVDWAVLDYNWRQYLGFRAGKVKGPVGLRNRSRDVDNLRTSIILNQNVYMEGLREMVVAVYGFSPYGSVSLGPLGDIDYDFYAGKVEVSSDNPFISEAFNRLTYTDPSFKWLNDNLGPTSFSISIKHIEGGLLVWNTPLAGLSLGITEIVGEFDTEMFGLTLDSAIDRYSFMSARYDVHDFSFIFERTTFKATFSMPDSSKISSEFEGWYGEFSWKVLDTLYLGLSYGEYYPESNDKDGKDIAAGGLPDYYAWQKDTTLSSKVNINEYLCIKFEVHFINGLGLTDSYAYLPGEMKKYWNLYAFKASINF